MPPGSLRGRSSVPFARAASAPIAAHGEEGMRPHQKLCRQARAQRRRLWRPQLARRLSDERGASVYKMRDVSRHKSMEVLQGYVRDADMFRDHAGAGLL